MPLNLLHKFLIIYLTTKSERAFGDNLTSSHKQKLRLDSIKLQLGYETDLN